MHSLASLEIYNWFHVRELVDQVRAGLLKRRQSDLDILRENSFHDASDTGNGQETILSGHCKTALRFDNPEAQL